MSKSNKILITGCAGFIGYHLSNRLLLDGYSIVGIDNLNDYYDAELKYSRLNLLKDHDNFTFIYGSLEDKNLIEITFSEHVPSSVVNLAAQAGVRYSIDNPHAYIQSNIVGFMNILEACRHHKISHLLYASSSSVYGSNEKMPFSVNDFVDTPISLYAATKKANELMAHTYSHLYGLKTTGLRFFTVYGPWGRPDMALFKFTNAILNGEPISVFNNGEMKRDFTYIDDIVEGIVRLIEKKPPASDHPEHIPYKVYNIGNNQPVDLMHFISVLEDKLGQKAEKNLLPLQPGDVPATYADVDDLMRDVDFKPATTVEEGIGKFVDWYKKYYGLNPLPNKIGVVGLGYVGLPAAIAFSEKFPVIGFDISSKRVNSLKQHVDYTGEVSKKVLNRANILFTEDPVMLKECGFIIVTVPTPIDLFKRPDLSCLISASEIIGNQLQKGTTVIYESTVYPGATEEICIPILEKKSGLKSGEDFFVGYSPERINPGDKEHTFKSITKVISAQNKEAMYTIAKLYKTAVDKVYIAPSIKVAEASKIIENIQRDINIALMNELAMLFHELEIDTSEVLRTANTKWNFLQFTPGLVGGHCIGVDPYYLTSKAENMGYHPEMILTGRKVNEGLSQFIVSSLLKLMTQAGISIEGSRVTILGFTFKENISDIRNSKVFDMIQQLNQSGAEVQVSDELADPEEVLEEYDLSLYPLNDLQPGNSVIVAVPHQQYKERGWEGVQSLLLNGKGIVLDIKNVLDHTSCPEGITLWRL
ncbi:nucleotide sugar dehydrogenase [Bacillus sp. PAMC26568]|nr:nucleotide sugar dehydrogenase [Bacillus sp. PAMC26568]